MPDLENLTAPSPAPASTRPRPRRWVRVLSLSVAAGCLAAFAIRSTPSSAAPSVALAPTAKVASATREHGPTRLAALLARYDAMKPGPARDQLARAIDTHAGQRHATVSRLYWYTDLDAAKAAAAAQRQPILHLRMLGRLDEDLSCANSRFFRTTLYANTETSKFLRDNFVLYWSSERPVPRVTIDFGDGRKLERTTTGNSAHYVMDERGNVLDVLPGLYAPLVFRSELAKSLALARSVRGLEGRALVEAVVLHHQAQAREGYERFAAAAAGVDYIPRRGRLIDTSEIGNAAIARAQRATYAKAMVEVVDLRKIGIDAGTIDRDDLAQWATVGQKVWNIGLDAPKAAAVPQRARLRRVNETTPLLLDRASLALVDQVRAGNPRAPRLADLVARLEQAILADTALNDLQLRQRIRSHIETSRDLDFTALNAFIYATVFHTPKADPWLGLLDATDFTGLPADGVVMP